MKFILAGGEKSDFLQACPLLAGKKADPVLADKGYAAGYRVNEIEAMGAEATIPSKSATCSQLRCLSVQKSAMSLRECFVKSVSFLVLLQDTARRRFRFGDLFRLRPLCCG